MNRDETGGSGSLKWRDEAAAGDVVREGTMRSTVGSVGERAAVIRLRLGRRRWSESVGLLALFMVRK